jgi:serine/threonine-protein kinase
MQLLGEGGMGEVYKAIDTMVDREVAIKVLRPEIARNQSLLQRFRAEATTLAKLNHSGIATLYTFMQQGDDFFMVLEYVPGKTLEKVEREHGALACQTAVPLFIKILDAMAPAHEMGIFHRDVKPANIMLTTWGSVKLMDFGIARVMGAARQTREGALVGTMEYIPPERVKGMEGAAAGDIYSLGVLLFEMIAGRLPFQSANEYELMRMHTESAPPTFASLGVEVPPEIEAIVVRSMAKAEADRYASCEDFAEALRVASGNLTISKREIIALVGDLTVSELGTAGHRASSSAETFQQAGQGYGPGQSTAPQSVAGWSAGSSNVTPPPAAGGWKEFVSKRKIPLLAVAALLLAIAGGIGAGLLSRGGGGGSDPSATEQKLAPIERRTSTGEIVPETETINPVIPAEPASPVPVVGIPIPGETGVGSSGGGSSVRHSVKPSQSSARKKSLDALNQ